MPTTPDLNEYIQPSPHSQEGVDELHQKVVQPVRELTGDRLPYSELKPPTLDGPIPAEFHNVYQEAMMDEERPAKMLDLADTRARVTESNKGVLSILINKLRMKGAK